MLRENVQIEEKIRIVQSKLKELPEGKLLCCHNGKYQQWRWSNGDKQIYIPKKQRILAEKLAYKKYLLIQFKNLLHEKKAVELYLTHHDSEAEKAEEDFIHMSEYKELLNPYFKPISQELQEWAAAPYEKNNKYPERLIHKTYSGIFVRSKSESLIEMFLYKNNIPFRYECALYFGEVCFYPDFTIRHPKTGKIFYWEQFGMMDDPDYCRQVYSKLEKYTLNGIYPTIQLITTYETKEHPLTAETVEQIIRQYFLE